MLILYSEPPERTAFLFILKEEVDWMKETALTLTWENPRPVPTCGFVVAYFDTKEQVLATLEQANISISPKARQAYLDSKIGDPQIHLKVD